MRFVGGLTEVSQVPETLARSAAPRLTLSGTLECGSGKDLGILCGGTDQGGRQLSLEKLAWELDCANPIDTIVHIMTTLPTTTADPYYLL